MRKENKSKHWHSWKGYFLDKFISEASLFTFKLILNALIYGEKIKEKERINRKTAGVYSRSW